MVDVNKFEPIGRNYEKNDMVSPEVFYHSARICGLIAAMGAENVQRVLNDYAALCADGAEQVALEKLRLSGEGFA